VLAEDAIKSAISDYRKKQLELRAVSIDGESLSLSESESDTA
jgi:hypothetical protein